MRGITDPVTRRLVQRAVREGWRVKDGRHITLYSPDGKTIVTTARTPSDHRSVKNFRARLKRGGVEGPR